METQNLRQRTRDEATATDGDTNAATADMSSKSEMSDIGRRQRRVAMAKRGLKSMGMAVSLPLLLTLTNIYFFGTSDSYKMSNRPNWVPPIWALHMACLGSATLMGICGWIVWADGGFHRKPNMMGLYLGQLALSLLWDPLVFRMRANGVGLMVALGVCYALFQCYKNFRQVNQIAGDLVLPCLGWAGLLAFVNLKFLLTY